MGTEACPENQFITNTYTDIIKKIFIAINELVKALTHLQNNSRVFREQLYNLLCYSILNIL